MVLQWDRCNDCPLEIKQTSLSGIALELLWPKKWGARSKPERPWRTAPDISTIHIAGNGRIVKRGFSESNALLDPYNGAE
jgi:hypothetical protein